MEQVMVTKYNIWIRILHWVIGVAVLCIMGAGMVMTEMNFDTQPMTATIYNIHKAAGVIILGLAFIRMIIKYKVGTPPYSFAMSKSLSLLADVTHKGLYMLLLAVPLLGLLASLLSGYGVELLGLTTPSFMKVNGELAKMMIEYHGLLAYVMLSAIGLHIAAAIKHRYIDKHDIFGRII
jgi:cytochrome b561